MLKGKRALITGASSGIGRAIALRLAETGAKLQLLGRDEKRLAEVAQKTGGTMHVLELSNDEALGKLSQSLASEPLEILIHSAGIVSLGSVATAPVAALDEQYRVNLRAPFLLSQLLLPAIIAAKGQIVFINSGAGLSAHANWSQYCASKHGLKALADSLRAEVNAQGVRVISIYPGRTASPMQEQVRSMEGLPYTPENLVQAEDIAREVVSVLGLAPSAQVTDLSIRPVG